MGLGRVTTSRLKGRARNWRRALVVTDPAGETVVKAAFGKLARPAYAVFDTAGGRWTIEQGARSAVTGIESAAVLSGRGTTVATIQEGAILLADDETLSWKLSGLLRKRCRIGPDLWTARPGGARNGRFRAELSAALLAREDLSLLAGLFSVLSYRSFQESGAGFAALPFDI